MKLLLMAYECSPYRGSECAVGWGRLLGAAKVAETHVVTSETNYAALERACEEGLLPPNVHFHHPAPDAKLRKLEKKPVLFAYNYQAYHHWQVLARQLIHDLHRREAFDLVHQVNVCTFREPGYGHTLKIPFVWGPMGGTQNFPARFLPTLSPKEALKEGLRGVANHYALRKPRVGKAARQATKLFVANSTNVRDFTAVFKKVPELLLETGLHEVIEPDRSRFRRRITDAKNRSPLPLRLLWSGELQTRKALPVLLRALRLLPVEIEWRLDVLGDGPLRERWVSQTKEMGLASRVRFLGRLPFEEATAYMQVADLFCFSSLRDTSGNVVLEALAAGVPVVCFDHQGASDMVNASCGVKLPIDTPRKAYRDWANTIAQLARDGELLLRLSLGATVQARRFLWTRNHDVMNAVYKRLLAGETSNAGQVESARRTHGEMATSTVRAGVS